jgi:hypothetical protein
VIRTEKITPLDGTPPKRFVFIAFDSMEKAMAWKASASSTEVDVIRDGTTKSTQFLVEGLTHIRKSGPQATQSVDAPNEQSEICSPSNNRI